VAPSLAVHPTYVGTRDVTGSRPLVSELRLRAEDDFHGVHDRLITRNFYIYEIKTFYGTLEYQRASSFPNHVVPTGFLKATT
jgi:hypothetical protein